MNGKGSFQNFFLRFLLGFEESPVCAQFLSLNWDGELEIQKEDQASWCAFSWGDGETFVFQSLSFDLKK